MKRLLRAAEGDPDRLVALLVARLSLSDAEARTLLRRGAVELDGKRAMHDGPVAVGARIVAFVRDEAAPQVKVSVAYQDEHILVLDKPAGLRSQAVRGDQTDTLIARAKRIAGGASLLHRLDRETSGLVLFPLTDRARLVLQKALEDGKIDRRYVARVKGTVTEPLRIALRIARDPRDPRRRLSRAESDTTGDAAVTHVVPVTSDDESSVVRLTLETGRTHQLRVHLSAVGHAIYGDAMYEGPSAERLCLHAEALHFPHPHTGKPRIVESAPPAIITTLA